MIILRREMVNDDDYIETTMKNRFPRVLKSPTIKNMAFRHVSRTREIIFRDSDRGADHYAIFLIANNVSMNFGGYMADTTLAKLALYNASNTKNYKHGNFRIGEAFYVVSLLFDLVLDIHVKDPDDDMYVDDDDDDVEGIFKWDWKSTKNIDLIETMLRDKTPLEYCKNPMHIANNNETHNIVLHFLIAGFNRSNDLLERIVELETQIHPPATLDRHLKNLRVGFKKSTSIGIMRNPCILSLLNECQVYLGSLPK